MTGGDGAEPPRLPEIDPRLTPEQFWPRLAAALDAVESSADAPPPDARIGAVLVLLEDTPSGPRVVLTRRRADLRSHPGQISFPGGRVDPEETFADAAVREAREEVGLDPASVELIGVGPTFYIPPSRFWVVPVVARWVAPHRLRPNPWEVDTILRVPVAQLLERARWRHVPLALRGSSWAWQLDGDLLWGATAVVCGLLLDAAVPGWSQGLAPHDLGDGLAVRPWEQASALSPRSRLGDGLPHLARASVRHVTAAEMRAVDHWMDSHGLGLVALVESAGRGVVEATRLLLDRSLRGVTVTVAAGPRGNGSGGLAAARMLAAAGAAVTVVLTGAVRLPWQRRLLEEVGVAVHPAAVAATDDLPAGDVVVDAMLGIGAVPPLRDGAQIVGEWLRRHDAPVVALDLPSGIDADAGLRGTCVTADVTVTLAAPKVGLSLPVCQPFVGDLYVADLGVPDAAWRASGVEPAVGLFADGALVRLTVS